MKNKHEEFVRKIEEKYPKTFEIITNFENRESSLLVKHLICGETFKTKARFLLETGRPKCCETKKLTKNKVQELIDSKWPKKFEVLTENPKDKEPILLKHIECGENFEVLLKIILRNGMAKCCEGQIRTKERFEKELEKKQSGVYEILSEFKGMKSNLKVKHLECGNIFERKAQDILKGSLPCCFENSKKARTVTSKKTIEKKWGTNKFKIIEKNKIKKIKCCECGTVYEKKIKYINKLGCVKCNEKKRKINYEKEYLRKIEEKYPDQFDNIRGLKNKNNKIIKVRHKKCGKTFEIEKQTFLKTGAAYCCDKKGISILEKEIVTFIKKNYTGEVKTSSRNIINPFELDIYLPELNLAFEFDGLYWHSNVFKSADYHLNKTKMCKEKKIKLIHIFEDEWLEKKDLVKSKILSLINSYKLVISASKTKINCLTKEEKDFFLAKNSLEGTKRSSTSISLIYKNEIIASMGFSKTADKKKFNMNFFIIKNETKVFGAFSKMLKAFLSNKDEGTEVISQIDRRWSDGHVYIKNGFELIKEIKPKGWGVKQDKRTEEKSSRKIFDCGKEIYCFKK